MTLDDYQTFFNDHLANPDSDAVLVALGLIGARPNARGETLDWEDNIPGQASVAILKAGLSPKVQAYVSSSIMAAMSKVSSDVGQAVAENLIDVYEARNGDLGEYWNEEMGPVIGMMSMLKNLPAAGDA